MSNLVPAAAGAAAITAGMTLAIDKPKALIPAFLAGWGGVTYGLTDGFKSVDPLVGAGVAGVVGGAMLSRAPAPLGTIGKPLFLAGWGALAWGAARQRGISPVLTLVPAALIVAGAMMMRKNAFGGGVIPGAVPPLVFAAGWALFLAAATPR